MGARAADAAFPPALLEAEPGPEKAKGGDDGRAFHLYSGMRHRRHRPPRLSVSPMSPTRHPLRGHRGAAIALEAPSPFSPPVAGDRHDLMAPLVRPWPRAVMELSGTHNPLMPRVECSVREVRWAGKRLVGGGGEGIARVSTFFVIPAPLKGS